MVHWTGTVQTQSKVITSAGVIPSPSSLESGIRGDIPATFLEHRPGNRVQFIQGSSIAFLIQVRVVSKKAWDEGTFWVLPDVGDFSTRSGCFPRVNVRQNAEALLYPRVSTRVG